MEEGGRGGTRDEGQKRLWIVYTFARVHCSLLIACTVCTMHAVGHMYMHGSHRSYYPQVKCISMDAQV